MGKIHNDAGGELDATFAVLVEDGTIAIYYESRGPGRNREYGPGLEMLLQRLAHYPATILEASVASVVALKLPESQRRIEIDGYSYPIHLPLVTDVHQFRLAFGAAQGRVAREPDATGSGNAT